MLSKSAVRVAAVLIFSTAFTAQAQVPTRTTRFYSFPVELKVWECCTPADPVVALDEVGRQPVKRTVTKLETKGVAVFPTRARSTCTDLSTLTPAEKLERVTRGFLGTCYRAASYEHVVCGCENLCSDPSFSCNCPGLPPGEVPDTSRRQDSLRSQPELILEICEECSPESSACGEGGGGGGGPIE